MQHDKSELREQALARRRAQSDRAECSRLIMDRLRWTAEFQRARTLLWYVSVRSEVETRDALAHSLADGRTTAIPYCERGRLRLFELRDLAELERGSYGIPEPRRELRESPEREVAVERLDLVVVPGVAFDPSGTRLGYGKGYYDKLLAGVEPRTCLLAPAFDCQLFPRLPREPHDVRMHLIVTETRLYRCGD